MVAAADRSEPVTAMRRTLRFTGRTGTASCPEAVGLDCGVVAPERPAALTVLDGNSDNPAGVTDPVRAAVRRATALDVERVVL